MIKKLTIHDKEKILAFSYRRERENLFVIGSFNKYKVPFEMNHYFGYFKDGNLAAVAAFFTTWQSFTINADDADAEAMNALVEEIVKAGLTIKYIPVFERYALPMIERLKMKHKVIPKKIKNETVYLLTQDNFRDFSEGDETTGADSDAEEIIRLDRIIEDRDPCEPITENERQRFNPSTEFLVKIDGKIVSKANISGLSEHYFQIGGVGTLPQHRGHGCAKRAVSSLCRHYFNKGLKYALLFTDNNNLTAQKIYKHLGFIAADKFIIAEYD